MGHKVSPIGLRTGVAFPWRSSWFAGKGDYVKFLDEDRKIRAFLEKNLSSAGVSKVIIERRGEKTKILVPVAKPGLAIGRGGSAITLLKKNLAEIIKRPLDLEITEEKEVSLSAKLIAERIAFGLLRRRAHKRLISGVAEETVRAGAKGIKIELSGRIGGKEIARRERFKEGAIPLTTLRANVDFGKATSHTRYGAIGVKVWVYRGEV